LYWENTEYGVRFKERKGEGSEEGVGLGGVEVEVH
jgi:hypothetical protein